MDHIQIVRSLIEIGERLGFESRGRTMGKLYELASADCVWYYPKRTESGSIFHKLAEQDGYDKIPVVAFEVAFNEKEKALRGSLSSLQILNASVSVIILAGKSREYRKYLEDLIRKFAINRIQIWTEDDVITWYQRITGAKPEGC